MIFDKPIAIVAGIRTPIAKADTSLASMQADDLATIAVNEILAQTGLRANIDEIIVGNVAQPVHAQNIARVIGLKAGIPISTPAVTVNRNCASGMEAITQAANLIQLNAAKTVLAAGVESMSNIPVLYSSAMKKWLFSLMKAKTTSRKLTNLLKFRPTLLKPAIALQLGLTDPICNQLMGATAENLAHQFCISRSDQDDFALRSNLNANAAIASGYMARQIVPVPTHPHYKTVMVDDNGVRANQTIAQLARLKPFFSKRHGSVTVGNSSQISDAAAAVILMTAQQAKNEGRKVLGYLKGYAYVGCQPQTMGLGPVYATSILLKQAKLALSDINLIEMNEAFAAQVLANIIAFSSNKFATEYLGRTSAIGNINLNKLNVNGGAIALGHPLGMSGMRLVINLLHQLHQQNLHRGIATLCVGGGQGAALLLESA